MAEDEVDIELIKQESNKPAFIMVPRKLVIAGLVTAIVLFIGILASFQYTNYVDRRSNSYWCGIAVLFDDTYKKVPPPTETGKILQKEFNRIREGYRCK